VSARFGIAAFETVSAAADRRAALLGEPEPSVARVGDLEGVVGTLRGKVEFESGEEGREYEVLAHLLRTSIAETFRLRLGGLDLSGFLAAVADDGHVDVGDEVSVTDLLASLGPVDGLGAVCAAVGFDDAPSRGQAASAVEFAYEGLHLTRRVAKDPGPGRSRYRARSTE
jgi:magnesium chelatase subunit I